MPKAIRYKANSVVYFSGDFDEHVFLLNSGKIALNSVDVESGEHITEYIKTGEFFGVKSALGNYPREENAMVLTDSLVYSFTGKEFEAFAQTNTRIILQMIKVFSRQLRNVHGQLASLLDSKEETDPEEGLFTVINAFNKSQHYHAACQVGERYMASYQNGKYVTQVSQILQESTALCGKNFGMADTASDFTQGQAAQDSTQTETKDSIVKMFAVAEELLKNKKYEQAYAQYHSIIETGNTEKIGQAAYIGAGRCLLEQREYVRCMQLLTGFISQNPKSTRIAESLMYLGLCYENMNRPDKAVAFYDRAILLAQPNLASIIREIQTRCAKKLGGA